MTKLWYYGFVTFSIVLAVLFYVEALGGLLSGIFPITLWFFLTLAFGLAALVSSARRERSVSLTPLLRGITTLIVALLLAGYFLHEAATFGPFGFFLVLVAVALPVVSVKAITQEV